MPQKTFMTHRDATEPAGYDKVEEVLDRISELTSTEKSRFLRKLVKRTASRNPSEMNFLRSLVQAVPVGSNLEKLPCEIFTQVLSNLDAKTLGRLSGTCKRLSLMILGDHGPWEKVFQRENALGMISEVTRNFYSQISQSVHNSSRISHSPYSLSLPYTAAFFYESRLQRNWSKVIPGERPVGFECHSTHVVTCMEIDPKGRYIITGSDDGTIRLWNANITGTSSVDRELLIFTGHLGGVWALKVDWERGIVITGSTDRTLIIWDLNTGGRLKHLLGHTSTVRCVELCDDLVVSGSRDGTLRVWSLLTGECLHVLVGHSASVRCLSLGPEWGTIVSGSYDNTCRLWNLQTGQCLRIFEGHSNKVYAVTSTSEQIFSGSLDGTVRVWNPETGECLKKFEGHRALVGLVQSKEDLLKDVVISGSTDGSLQIIRRLSDETFASTLLPSAHPSSITSLDFNRNFLVTGSEGVVRLWSLESGRSDPCLLANLIENIDMVWRVSVSEHLAVIAYQIQGQTRMAVFNFAPQPQQILIEMRAFKTTISNNQVTVNVGNRTKPGKVNQNSMDTITSTTAAATTNITETENATGPVITNTTTSQQSQYPMYNTTFCNPTNQHHPELLVLGIASQSLVDTDELM